MVELAQWNRLRNRIEALEKRWSPNWLISAASALATLGFSTGVAWAALPSGQGAGIDPLVAPVLLIAAIACLVVSAVLVGLYFLVLGDRKSEGQDIQHEMDTIHSAWKSRGSET